jgi:hypothetical protein
MAPVTSDTMDALLVSADSGVFVAILAADED